MATTSTILSLSLLALFIQPSGDVSQEVFAEKNQFTLKTEVQTQDGVALEFSAPETIVAGKLVPINARVLDIDRDSNLSHTDW
ncbi:MAG: hypothetical protein ACE5EJ_01235, partial [Nitrosopumilaceae archaeon]